MGAVLPLHVALVHQPEVSFVNQCRALQSMIGALPAQVPARQTPQFAINERRQVLERLLIALAPVDEQPRDILLW